MGLLDYLSTHTYDEDYQTVAARRRAVHAPVRPWAARGAVAGLVLLAFALLVVTAGTQTSRNALALSDERKDLIAQINARQAAVRHEQQRIDTLQAENRLRARQLQADETQTRDLLGRVDRLSVDVGVTRVRGPGVSIVVDDAPHAGSDPRDQVLDSDLQQLVNGLWQAGAEAIAINGQRLTNLSAIRRAGSAITVNDDSLSRPYRVLAIGDADTLPARFAETSAGQTWFDLQQQVGLRFQMHARSSLILPRASTTLRYARSEHLGGNP
jgi:uncharacterized protein YlxW (UPF0749 family)